MNIEDKAWITFFAAVILIFVIVLIAGGHR